LLRDSLGRGRSLVEDLYLGCIQDSPPEKELFNLVNDVPYILTFRLLGFFHGKELIILTNSFQKKSQKTPSNEIRLAEKRKKDFLSRR
jgi:hypothetical protein